MDANFKRSLVTKTVCNCVPQSHRGHVAYTQVSNGGVHLSEHVMGHQLKKTSDQSPDIIPNKLEKEQSKMSKQKGRN